MAAAASLAKDRRDVMAHMYRRSVHLFRSSALPFSTQACCARAFNVTPCVCRTLSLVPFVIEKFYGLPAISGVLFGGGAAPFRTFAGAIVPFGATTRPGGEAEYTRPVVLD
jgi:hypothetical protein